MLLRMSKKKEEMSETPVTPAPDRFRCEAEEHAAKAERERLEHRANELGVTVAELQRGILPIVEEVPARDPHVLESLRESDKAAHKRPA